MLDWINWIKKHKGVVILVLLFAIAGVPFIIHCLFKLKSEHYFLMAEWSAGEILTYYGSVLAFIGTVVLGALALYQTELIKKEYDERAKMLERREHEKNMPMFVVKSRGCSGNCARLHFNIQNISDNLSTTIKLFDIHIKSPDGEIFWESKRDYSFAAIQAKEFIEITLENPSLRNDGYIFSIMMQCRDKYNETHSYEITGTYLVKDSYPKLEIKEK